MNIIFLLFFVLVSGNVEASSESETSEGCSGRAFAWDFQHDFRSERDGFDFCFKRVRWWGLDTSDGWRDRYCSSSRYNVGYNQFRWSNNFRHQFSEYRGRGAYDVLNHFNKFFSDRVFRGFPSRLDFQFDSDCGTYQ